jgi:hypothetical protein
MSDTTSNSADAPGSEASVSSLFSTQPTGMVETTFAETLGLSMHNAVISQQSSQMTTSASITNACARLLQSPTPVKASKSKKKAPEKPEPPMVAEKDETPAEEPKKKKFNIMNFLKKKKPEDEASGADSSASSDAADDSKAQTDNTDDANKQS